MSDNAVAWVFPGQGSQEVGMGRDLVEAFQVAREVFERADATLGRPISALCFEGPVEELNKTFNSQPAIFLTSMALLAAAREQGALATTPAFVAGHSVGEYTALGASGAVSLEDGLRLVETRGRVTQAAADATPGGMAAVLGLNEAATLAVCADAGAELCNLNSPGQIVIGGSKDAVAKACALALEQGAKRAIPLEVDGAFHTSLMLPAVPPFQEALAQTTVVAPEIPVIANDTAQPMTEPARIREELAFQLTHPVRWVQCVEYMVSQGVSEFVEIGPGKVLGGLIKRIAPPGISIRNINSAASVAA